MTTADAPKPPIWRAIWNTRMLICVCIGFSSGLPLYYLLQFIPAWLKVYGLSLKTIGAFALVMLPYSWKFVWSPLLDRYVPFMGRRRGWMLISQVGLFGIMMIMGWFDPNTSIWTIAGLSAVVGVLSATQDIAIDAFRREILPDNELGLGNSIAVNAYRVAGLVPGGLGLILAAHLPWSVVHSVVAVFMLPGILCTLLVSEPTIEGTPPKRILDAILQPFREFFSREGGWRGAIAVLAFMFFYKLGDNAATALITPFYLDTGFTTDQIGSVAKVVAFWSMIIGGFLGGLTMYRIGINRSLWIFGVVQMGSILGFATLAAIGPEIWALAVAVTFEYLGVGLGSAALVAFMAKQSDRRFTATQLSLFTSFMSLPRALSGFAAGTLIEGHEGWGITGIGYFNFFLVCTALAIPGMILLVWVAPFGDDPP